MSKNVTPLTGVDMVVNHYHTSKRGVVLDISTVVIQPC